MPQAIIFGSVAGSALILGAIFGNSFKFSKKVIASFMAFGSGVLICALTFGLMENAFKLGGFDAIIFGFLLGGLTFIGGDWWLHRIGARRHKKVQLIESEDESGRLITLGAVLDGVPESIALGIVLFSGTGGILMAAAIFLSNFPESISSISGLKREGYSTSRIYLLWLTVGVCSVIITVLSYFFLRDIDPNITGVLESFAAGAVLAMLADTMMPEAYSEGGFGVGIMTLLGFLAAFIISRV